jgi:bifunctional non-homologous end joining protein LigD
MPTIYGAIRLRSARIASVLAKAELGIRFNEHIEGDGPTVFAHACKMGLEGIVSKRKDSAYRSGRSPNWLKMKNSDAPAVKREAEEDWGK